MFSADIQVKVKIIVVVDSHLSAIGLAAHSRLKFQDAKILSADEFMSPQKLLIAISKFSPEVVFFAWRRALVEILKSCRNHEYLFQNLSGTTFGMLIPDLVGLTLDGRKQDSGLIDFVDFYMVTSSQLQKLYDNNFPEKPPFGLYRDFPDVSLIHEIRKSTPNPHRQQIIWVGNSKWGSHQGFVDHKGLRTIVYPLKKIFFGKLEFKIIDSHVKHLPHKMVLREIQNSKVLIQTSESEGTGLPVLEAASFGTVVITSDVGVVSDFLIGDLQKLVVERTVEAFAVGLSFALENYSHFQKLLDIRIKSYLAEIATDKLPTNIMPKTKTLNAFPSQSTMVAKVKWWWRWIRVRI
jgi:hypothetical protein